MRITRALATTALTTGTLALSVVLAPSAGADEDSGGVTTVVLNPELVPVLVDTLGVATISPGELSAPDGVAQVSFPITEVEAKEIEHSGGLQFSPVGGGSLTITEFEVDLRSGVLSADETSLNGERLGEVDIFQLGDPAFAGAFVGDACVVVKH